MRSAVASIVAAGVLALGAVPTTLALADEDTTKKDAGREATGREGSGPPAWAPAHGHHKTGAKQEDKAAAKALKREQQASWPEDKQGPPPWAKAYGKRDKVGQ